MFKSQRYWATDRGKMIRVLLSSVSYSDVPTPDSFMSEAPTEGLALSV